MSILEASSKKAAIRHPLATVKFLLGNKQALHRAIILESAAYLFGNQYNKNEWQEALNEIDNEQLLPQAENKDNIAIGNNLNTTFGKWIYCCVRVIKPEFMIETGVAHGASSWIILNAMQRNSKGRLYSIDLPDSDTNAAYNFKARSRTGWIVPEKLRDRWELHLGDAKKILPELLNNLKNIDIFFHDSDHSSEHMKFEFETILPFLSKEGVLLSDDVHKNDAYSEFVGKYKLKALQFNKGGCAVRI